MPKMKSHRSTAKHVRLTGSGKVVAERAGKRHKMEVKPSTRARRLDGTHVLSKGNSKRFKKLLAR